MAAGSRVDLVSRVLKDTRIYDVHTRSAETSTLGALATFHLISPLSFRKSLPKLGAIDSSASYPIAPLRRSKLFASDSRTRDLVPDNFNPHSRSRSYGLHSPRSISSRSATQTERAEARGVILSSGRRRLYSRCTTRSMSILTSCGRAR